MSYKVFISYDTEQLAAVRMVRNVLKAGGIETFVAEESIAPGENLPRKIGTALRECDMFLVLWSKQARQSTWVNQEIGAALALGKELLLVKLDGTAVPDQLRDRKYVTIGEDPQQALQALLARAKSLSDEKSERNFVGLGLVALAALSIFYAK